MSMVLAFPIKGQNKGTLPSEQPGDTTYKALNVRPYWQGRLRGGQRPGLGKWSSTQIGAVDQPVVAITSVTVVESP
jgi:hypothetical protein